MKKYCFIIFLFICLFTVACNKDDSENEEFDLDYFNSNLTASKYSSYEIKKVIDFDNLLLLEEITTVTKNIDVYDIVKTTKKLSKIENENQYQTSVEESKMKTIEDPMTLKFSVHCFSLYSISEYSLKGNIFDNFGEEVIGVGNISDISVEINLNQNKKVQDVKILYKDNETGFNVSLIVNYKY